MKRIVTVLTAVVVLVLPAAGLAAASDIPPPDCNHVYNPYVYTRSALAACRIPTYSMSSTTQLPDGGTSYNYDLGDGSTLSLPVPPSGFDPATAPESDLALYGLSPRPPQTDLENYAAWVAAYSHLNWSAAPPWVANLHNPHPQHTLSSGNWAGFEAYTSDKPNYFTSLDGTYAEPQITQASCSSSQDASFWSGIGGDVISGGGYDWLGQNGTAFDNGGHNAWAEVVKPGGGDALNMALNIGKITHGDTIRDSSVWTPSEPDLAGSVADDTTHTTHTVQGWELINSSMFSGYSAELVLETATGILSNFGTWNPAPASINNTQTFANYPSSGSDPLRERDVLSNGSAITSSLNSDGSFTVTWNNKCS